MKYLMLILLFSCGKPQHDNEAVEIGDIDTSFKEGKDYIKSDTIIYRRDEVTGEWYPIIGDTLKYIIQPLKFYETTEPDNKRTI